MLLRFWRRIADPGPAGPFGREEWHGILTRNYLQHYVLHPSAKSVPAYGRPKNLLAPFGRFDRRRRSLYQKGNEKGAREFEIQI